MKRRTYLQDEAERMVPLLRSIGREIRQRSRSVQRLEKRLGALERRTAEDPAETQGLVAEIAVERREIRLAKKELERLGCSLDEQHPLRILIPSKEGAWAYEGHLEETGYHAAPGGAAA